MASYWPSLGKYVEGLEQAGKLVRVTTPINKDTELHPLGRLPIPVSTPGFDNAPYTTAGHWVTRDPETGMHNLGNYRGMVKAENRIGVLLGRLNWGMRYHIDRWRERGITVVPAAVVIGAPP